MSRNLFFINFSATLARRFLARLLAGPPREAFEPFYGPTRLKPRSRPNVSAFQSIPSVCPFHFVQRCARREADFPVCATITRIVRSSVGASGGQGIWAFGHLLCQLPLEPLRGRFSLGLPGSPFGGSSLGGLFANFFGGHKSDRCLRRIPLADSRGASSRGPLADSASGAWSPVGFSECSPAAEP